MIVLLGGDNGKDRTSAPLTEQPSSRLNGMRNGPRRCEREYMPHTETDTGPAHETRPLSQMA